MSKKIVVRQTKSTARHHPSQLATLRALGLGRIGKTKEHTATPSTLGMLKSVAHLITVSDAGAATKKKHA